MDTTGFNPAFGLPGDGVLNPTQIFQLGYLYYDAEAHFFANLIEDITWKVIYQATSTESEDATQSVQHRYFLQIIDVSEDNPIQEVYESQSQKSEWSTPGAFEFPNIQTTGILEVDFTRSPEDLLLYPNFKYVVFLCVECQAIGGTEEVPFAQTMSGVVLESFIRTEYTIPA